jgi:phage I-like protein
MKQPASSRSLPRVVTAVALAAAGDGAQPPLPTRMRILAWGDNPNSQGVPVRVGQRLVEAMREPTYPFRQIALDYEHNTWPGSKAYQETREPREVAAFLTVEAVEGQGVFVNVDRWTPSGLRHAPNFCDLSATPLLDKDGNVTAIVSVALSRTGAVPDIVFEQAAAMSAAPQPDPHGETMNWKEMIAKYLGLAPEATDEEVQAAWKAHLEQTAAATAKAAEAGGGDGGGAATLSAEAIGGIVATAVRAQTAGLAARLDGQEKQRLIDAARAEGKVVALADTLLSRMTVEELRTHVAALPPVVPLAALTPVKIAEGRTVTLNATELTVCRSLGLSAEAYAKEKGVAP